jgi:hypothetical protein
MSTKQYTSLEECRREVEEGLSCTEGEEMEYMKASEKKCKRTKRTQDWFLKFANPYKSNGAVSIWY